MSVVATKHQETTARNEDLLEKMAQRDLQLCTSERQNVCHSC